MTPSSGPTSETPPTTVDAALQDLVSRAEASSAKGHAFIALVCGAKGTGKSTSLRRVMRQYLGASKGGKARSCFYLDTDVGQCEFTPSGMLSLHLVKEQEALLSVTDWDESEEWYYRQPQHAQYLGDSTAKLHPNVYIEHIKSLEKVFRALSKSAPGSPLLINTHGWGQGMGSLLVQGIADIFDPDVILNIKHEASVDAFNFEDRKNVVYARSALDVPKPRVAPEVRYAHLLKYFLRNDPDADPYWWFTSTPPFCIRADKVAVVDTGGELPKDFQFLSLALNAAIVGLVSSVDNGKCHGIGFVRSVALDINGKDSMIFLVTSEKQEILKRVDTLVLGSERFPLDKLCSRTIVDENTPYLMHSSELLVGLNEPSKANKRNLKRRRLVHSKQ